MDMNTGAKDYATIEQAILYLEAHRQDHPSLEDIARYVGLSKYHFHRLFMRWAGTTPKRFLQFLTLASAKEMLAASNSVLDVAINTGLSGPGRLHDLLVVHEGVTPGEFKLGGAGLTIVYGWHNSPFGECLLALTARGICALMFVGSDGHEKVLGELRKQWPNADLQEMPDQTAPVSARVFKFWEADGAPSGADHTNEKIHLAMAGTNFQMSVWRALLEIPSGETATYGDLARRIGRPGAARAVGRAVGANPVALLIPCHRIIRKVGGFGEYRWGHARKQAILSLESARKYYPEEHPW